MAQDSISRMWCAKSLQSCLTLRTHGLQPARLLCSWNSPGKNTGVGSHSLLHGIFPTQGSNLGLPHCRQILYQLSHQESPISRICDIKVHFISDSQLLHLSLLKYSSDILKNNPPTVKFTHFRHTFWWVLTSMCSCRNPPPQSGCKIFPWPLNFLMHLCSQFSTSTHISWQLLLCFLSLQFCLSQNLIWMEWFSMWPLISVFLHLT